MMTPRGEGRNRSRKGRVGNVIAPTRIAERIARAARPGKMMEFIGKGSRLFFRGDQGDLPDAKDKVPSSYGNRVKAGGWGGQS